MHPRSSRAALLTVAAAIAALVLVVNASSCATAGQGGSPGTDASSDDSATTDATMDTSTGPQEGGGGECDADTMTDPDNCGSCGNTCPSKDTCSCGMCTPPCSGNMTPCCGQCVDVNTDPNNCGTCNNVCAVPNASNPICKGGACSFTCAADAGADGGGPLTFCGADAGTPGCYDLTSSAQACGACGKACPGTNVCVDSQCCTAGDGICGGVCTPLDTALNCGACDAGCAAPAMCMSGMCVGYVETTSAAPFVDACSITGNTGVPAIASQGGWVSTVAFTLPIAFSFYGTSETKVWLGSEGTLGFGVANGIGYPDDCSSGAPPPLFTNYAAIVAFGDENLVPGEVCYATTGTAPNRQFVATWDSNTYSLDGSFALNISIVLSETTNAVDLLYSVPASGLDGGAEAGAEAGADGGPATVLITDSYVAGRYATFGLQQSNATRTTLSTCSAYLMSSPFGVHLIP